MNDAIYAQSDESQPLSLRERKKRLAQATIEEAALRLFQERGYEQTSIQDIADAVMMSSRTFFRYFASKEELEAATNRQEMRFLVALYMTALRVALEEWLEQEAQGDIVSLLRRYLDSSRRFPTMTKRNDQQYHITPDIWYER